MSENLSAHYEIVLMVGRGLCWSPRCVRGIRVSCQLRHLDKIQIQDPFHQLGAGTEGGRG